MNKTNKTSFKTAIIDDFAILREPRDTSWFGRRVYLGFNDQMGWKVYELSLLGWILRKLNLKYQDTHRNLILRKIETIPADEAELVIKHRFLRNISTSITDKLQAHLTEEQSKKLIVPSASPTKLSKQSDQSHPQPAKTSKNIPEQNIEKKPLATLPEKDPESEIFSIYIPPEYLNSTHDPSKQPAPTSPRDENLNPEDPPLHPITSSVVEANPILPSIDLIQPPIAATPLYLKNYKASRCYLDSVLDMVLSQDEIRRKVFADCQRKDLPEKKMNVLFALRHLILSAHEPQMRKTRLKNSPAEKVREAIFAYSDSKDLKGDGVIYTQQDAAYVLMLINNLLGITCEPVDIDIPIDEGEGRALPSQRPASPTPILHLNFSSTSLKETSLIDLFDHYSAPKKAVSSRGDIETRRFADEEEALRYPFTSETKLMSPPPFLALQIKRYDNASKKIEQPVSLPSSGIIDIASYTCCQEQQPTRYEITGYVVHKGNQLDGGHYLSKVKIGEEFYHCDDMNPQYYQKISAKEFYEEKKAYLVMLKRI